MRALSSAFANDVDGMLSYAQQLNGYGKAGDVFLGISTSGNAENVMYAAVTAKAKGLKVDRSHRKDRRKARKARRCRYHRAGAGDLQDPGTPPADLPCALPDAGRQILCGIVPI